MGDECLESIGEFIKNSKTIEVMNIGGNKITDKGIEILSNYLEGNKILKKLCLAGNEGITDKSVPLSIKNYRIVAGN